MTNEELQEQLAGAQYAAAQHLKTVQQQAKIISGMAPRPIPASHRLLPVALHPAIEEALKRHCMMPVTAWQDVIAAWDRLRDEQERVQKVARNAIPYAAPERSGKTADDEDAIADMVVRDAALEEAAMLLLNGSFLHDEAPGARLAREAAKAIRELKTRPAPAASSSAAPSAGLSAAEILRKLRMGRWATRSSGDTMGHDDLFTMRATDVANFVRELLADATPSVQAVAAGQEWQPIETAPKDGTYIMLGNAAGSWVGMYEEVFQSGYRPSNPWQSMMLNNNHMNRIAGKLTPTHWMPLLKPPALAGDTQAGE